MLHRLVINSPHFRKTVDLKDAFYTIGRHSSNSIIIYSEKMSRRHATIVKKKEAASSEESFYIFDGDLDGNKSKNGIFINGKQYLEYELKHGDIIHLSDDIIVSYYIINKIEKIIENSNSIENGTILIHKPSLNFSDEWKSTDLKDKPTLPNHKNYDLAKLASLVELSPNPIIEIDWQGEINYLNSSASHKFPNLEDLKLNHPLFENLLNNHQHRNGNLLIREIEIGEETFEQHIHYFCDDKIIRVYIFDITQRKLAEETLHYQAYYDNLTSLPNRTLFNEKLSTALAHAYLNQYKMALLFIDLDGFKKINDTLGHTLGDQLLQSFAKRLKEKLRGDDLMARWGGDEFTLLIPKIDDVDEAKLLAQRILDILKQPFDIGGQLLYLKTSIGIAIYPQDGVDSETLVKNADAALYRTKEWGRNNYQFYTPTITSETSESLQIENLLHEAIEKEQFVLHYQPQINIKTKEICGMEALIRWQHPELGLISPAKFIPIAEESGLIVSIGEWVLRTACQENCIWQKAGIPPLRIAVNLSAQQFQQPNLINLITDILTETGLDPQLLELEITETTIMQNMDFALQVLLYLRQMGIHISMDDFGTGYSSLGYLKRFPFHTIKIDQTFVKDLKDQPEDLAIISAVLAIGKGFNLRVIAEGVETDQQVQLLKDMNCEEMQGYKFSRPLTSEDAMKFLSFYHTQL